MILLMIVLIKQTNNLNFQKYFQYQKIQRFLVRCIMMVINSIDKID